MELVEIGDYKVGDNLIIDFGEKNPNNKEVQVRAIIDMEVVILIDKNQNYLMETIKYMNLLCKFGNITRVTKKGEIKFEDLVHDPRI
jgi:hypothetical protein